MDLFKKKRIKKNNERVRASEKEKRDISLSLSLSRRARAPLEEKSITPPGEKEREEEVIVAYLSLRFSRTNHSRVLYLF